MKIAAAGRDKTKAITSLYKIIKIVGV